jgi:hypothetical protein
VDNFFEMVDPVALKREADELAEDMKDDSINGLLQNFFLAAQTGMPFRGAPDQVIPRTGMTKVAEPHPEAAWTPSLTITPHPDSPLAKRASTSDAKREGIKAWIRDCILTKGETVQSLADFARESDPAYADLILKIGAEL